VTNQEQEQSGEESVDEASGSGQANLNVFLNAEFGNGNLV
jgi:hypothetical protein